mgnify:CR=1 FL=1
MAAGPLIEIRDLRKRYTVLHNRPYSFKDAMVRKLTRRTVERETFWALKGVSLTVQPGDTVGIIGPNGSGKSTMLGIIARILRPTEGSVEVRGRVSVLMEAGVGFHEDLTGIENIYLSGALLGLTRREIAARVDSIVEFADLHGFADTPVRMLSSGMYVRLGFAVAVHLEPEILLVDEVLAVGDEEFHHKCRQRLREFCRGGGAVVFVSHRMPEVKWLCERTMWLENGLVHREGPTPEVVAAYVAAHQPDVPDWDIEEPLA